MKKAAYSAAVQLRGKDLNLRPLGYEPLFLMGVLVISTISVSSNSVYLGLFWAVGPRFAPALAPMGANRLSRLRIHCPTPCCAPQRQTPSISQGRQWWLSTTRSPHFLKVIETFEVILDFKVALD